MKIRNIQEFTRGWFIGNFKPAVHTTPDFEICLKTFAAGEGEPDSVQGVATEVTLVVSGEITINGRTLGAGDICSLAPREMANFFANRDSVVIGIKFPSLPNDKKVIE